MPTILPPTLSDRAVELFIDDWRAFECTGDIQILYNRLYYLSVDLLELRRQLCSFEHCRDDLDKFRVRNYRLTQRLAKLQNLLKDVNYEILQSSKKRTARKSRASSHQVSSR